MTALLLLLWLAASGALGSEELRVGVFVGNNEGATGQQRLLFATADARKMRDLFVSYGGIDERDAILLLDESRRGVQTELVALRERIAAARTAGRPTTLVFFYSGHGDDTGLQLGASALPHDELRLWLEASGADVRIAMLDACQSGGAVRQKGGTRGPSAQFAIDVQSTRGTAVLTSSSASEYSQESQELGGGYFTYYLHSALLGAADEDGDGVVDLNEAYAYVYAETAFNTRHAPETQTPSYDFDLTGAGSVQLTRLEEASAALIFTGKLEGTYAVWDETRKRYVAEVDASRLTRLALPPGSYYLHHRMPGWVDEASYLLGAKDEVVVRDEDFLSVSYERIASRGDLQKQVRRATMPDLNLQAAFGLRGFGARTVQNREYFPSHPVGGISARMLPVEKGAYWGFDLYSGGAPGTLHFDQLGDQDVFVRSTSVGAVAGWSTRPLLVRAGIGGRAEVVWFVRDFLDDDLQLDTQGAAGFAPGTNAWIGLHGGRVNVDLNWNLLVLPMRWDDHRAGAYSELLLSGGYRF